MANYVCHYQYIDQIALSLEKSWLGSLISHCSLSNPTGVLRNHHFDVSIDSNEKFAFKKSLGLGFMFTAESHWSLFTFQSYRSLRNHHFDVSSDSNEKFGFPEVSGSGLYVYSRAAAGPNARQSLRETKTYDSWISWCMFYQIDSIGCPSWEFCEVKIWILLVERTKIKIYKMSTISKTVEMSEMIKCC